MTKSLKEKLASIRLEHKTLVRVRYEEYIHLPDIRETWSTNLTTDPKLEPCFAAGMQAIELGFVLISQFIVDSRTYVFKRPRIELIASDIQEQIRLLADILDGELEDEKIVDGPTRSLTQTISPDCAPPMKGREDTNRARQSSALEMLIESISSRYDSLSVPEKQSLRKVIRNITNRFETSFSEWKVKIGIEEQLSEIRELVGLRPLTSIYGKQYLDYRALVCPEIIVETLTNHQYSHKEDFFFRSVHLGTEFWAFIAHQRMKSALDQVNRYKSWYNASAHIFSAANIINYLGGHVKTLTSMVLKDYLELKVELEGTSGAGSEAVRTLFEQARNLFGPLETAMTVDSSRDLKAALMDLYNNPGKQPGTYNYAKSLEAIDTAISGGFFYSHYCLAVNVIGSQSRGTMDMAVKQLKNMCERAVFPELDSVRAELGNVIDMKLRINKGRIIEEIDRYTNIRRTSLPNSRKKGQSMSSYDSSSSDAEEEVMSIGTGIRNAFYATDCIPTFLQDAIENETVSKPKVSFLDHTWGQIPPEAHAASIKRQFALQQIGNASWHVMLSDIMPESAEYIKELINAPKSSVVEFSCNSNDFITKLIAAKMKSLETVGTTKLQLKILASDDSLNWSATLPCDILTDMVEVEPWASFPDRLVKAASEKVYDMILVSQITHITQENIMPNPLKLIANLKSVSRTSTFMVIDACHGFGAVDVDLAKVLSLDNVFYLSNILNHLGCGPDIAFLVYCQSTGVYPVSIDWVNNPFKAGPERDGPIRETSSTETSTPMFFGSLITFIEVIRRWKEKDITISSIHEHIMMLHSYFIRHLPPCGYISRNTLYNDQPAVIRSHTLVFKQKSETDGRFVQESLQLLGKIEVDHLKSYLRVGIGYYHNMRDIDRLLDTMDKILVREISDSGFDSV